MSQLALPVHVRPEEVMRKQSLGAAIELCAEVGGYGLDKTLQQELKVDKAQFLRWQSGTEGVPNFPNIIRSLKGVGLTQTDLAGFCGCDQSVISELATGDRELIEDSWRDDFWGWGPNRDGKNMLGKLWMEVRAELQVKGEA